MEKLPEVNIGMIGHVDHGKTTLTYALTGKWTMLHSEELKRGITIKLGYADAEIRKCKKCGAWTTKKTCPKCGSETELIRKVSFVDAPGHETLMAVMISGAAIMDGAILVVAANEPCPQPQTREHLMALKIMGVKNIIVVQNKIDLVTKEKAIENYNQIKTFIERVLGFEVPIIPISAQKEVNIDAVVQAIQEFIPTPKRDPNADPLMLVARSFDINKPGCPFSKLIGGVLGGSILRGVLKKGQEIEVAPGIRIEKKGGQVEWHPLKTKIASIACGGKLVDQKGPGGSVAISTLLDPAVTKADSLVGNVVGLPGKLPEVKYELEFIPRLFDHVVGMQESIKIEPIRLYEPLMISVGTATTLGVVQQAKERVKVNLKRPVCVVGKKIALARQIKNRWRLIGYGELVS